METSPFEILEELDDKVLVEEDAEVVEDEGVLVDADEGVLVEEDAEVVEDEGVPVDADEPLVDAALLMGRPALP